jgi:hypothetical protein
MDTRDKFVFGTGICVEVIAMGLGITGAPQPIVFILIAIGIIIFVYLFVRIIKYEPLYAPWWEVKARGEKKEYYLKPLRYSLNVIIDLHNDFVKEASELSLVEYDDKYYHTNLNRNDSRYNRRVLNKMEGNSLASIVTIPSGLSFVSNNPYYEKLKRGESNLYFVNTEKPIIT